MQKNRLDFLPVIANRGVLENGHIEIEFVHENRSCRRCGSCKGERIQEYRREHPQVAQVVFIGDGYSDACATSEADILLAKKDLERYCRDRDIGYYEYDDFYDVMRILTSHGVLEIPD